MRDNDLFETFQEMQQKLKDQEESIKVLKRVKNIYRQSEEVKCKGCKKHFQTHFFKGHVIMCP